MGGETSNRVPKLTYLRGGQAGFLYGVMVGVGPEVRPEGWLRWPAHPFGGIICRVHPLDTLLWLPAAQVAVGLFGLWNLIVIIRPNCVCTWLFLDLIVSLYFVTLGDVCPGASTTAKVLRPSLFHCKYLYNYVDISMYIPIFHIYIYTLT